jgi:cytochrome c biogenesis protein CcdA
MLLFFRLLDYIFITAAVGAILVIKFYPDNQEYLTYGAIALTVATFLFIVNRNSVKEAKKAVQSHQLSRKAELYTSLLSNNSSLDNNTVIPARTKALEYCQELIDDYKNARNLARTLYYVLQIATVILSGVTPILVLVDKLETGLPWLKWLPVICPALASIIASIVTSFPFQKNWIAANKAVELLEAEQEKFVLGISSAYRCYDVTGEVEQQQRISQGIEQFITQVNNIHLQQVQQSDESQSDKKDPGPATATATPEAPVEPSKS